MAAAIVIVGALEEELTGGAVDRPDVGGGCWSCGCCCVFEDDDVSFEGVGFESPSPDAAFFELEGAVDGGGATAITIDSSGFDSDPPITTTSLVVYSFASWIKFVCALLFLLRSIGCA